MKRSTRFLSALLTMLTTVSLLASCAKDAPPADTSAPAETSVVPAETTAPAETETDRTQIKDSLPDGLDFKGQTFSIYCATQTVQDSYVLGTEENRADVVGDAVYTRNEIVQDRLHFTLKSFAAADTYKTVVDSVSALVMSGDTTYDIFIGQQHGMARLVPQKMFLNAYDVQYLDFEQLWWRNNFMNEISLGTGYRFLLVGDFDTDVLSYTRTVWFNKNLYEKLYGSPDELYQLALDGKWTLDKMTELASGAYADLNGDGMTDKGDRLGYVAGGTSSSVDPFVYGSDVVFATRDKDGFIELKMFSEEAVLLAEKVVRFFTAPGTLTQFEGTQSEVFKAGNTLFLGNARLGFSINLRDMEDDFGALLYPKMDEAQSEYHSLVHDTTLLTGISVTAKEPAMVGAVLEAMNAESYRRVTPAWYESALKLKYSRDDITSQMVDLIRDSMTTNFIYAYSATLNNLGMVYRTLAQTASTDYVSTVTSRLPAAEKALADLVAIFKGN
ncbi:MAG: hypothetical protein E7662_09395 [Ruminococcaceae bacterium]|nr:hypothetical protein [Oscillospiraceae bacterium]